VRIGAGTEELLRGAGADALDFEPGLRSARAVVTSSCDPLATRIRAALVGAAGLVIIAAALRAEGLRWAVTAALLAAALLAYGLPNLFTVGR
jgi:hypothetical protein